MKLSNAFTKADAGFVRDTCLCFAAQRAARQLARHFDRAFAPLNLTNGQFSMLTAILGMQGASIGLLASFLAMDHATVSAAVKKLAARELVRIADSKKDARARHVTITSKGVALLSRALPIWKAEHAAIEARVGEGVGTI